MVECSARSFSHNQILKLIFLNVKQMAFTLMNEEFEFLRCLMTPSFNKDIRPHSQQLYSHQLLSIMSITSQYYCHFCSLFLIINSITKL